MKFNDLVSYITEHDALVAEPIVDEMAKPKNPWIMARAAELEKTGVSPATAYMYARKEFNAKQSSGSTPVSAPAVSAPFVKPVAGVSGTGYTPGVSGTPKYRDLPDTIRTKEAVADFLQHNPGAGEQEIIDAISSMDSEETPYNLDPDTIKAAIADVQSIPSDVSEEEPGAVDLTRARRHAAIAAAMARRGMKVGDPAKVLSKIKPKSTVSFNPDADEEDEEDFTKGPKIDMRDEPQDFTEV